jgi:hypothetical protein
VTVVGDNIAFSVPQQITSVVAVNNDSKFYSKWVYGEEFEIKFPIGSLISFDNYLFEFTSPEKAFVVASKKGAVMIITTVDNSTFENMYSNIDSTTYMNKFISGLDAIGVYDYINTNYENNISSWSEPNFYDKLYVGKKIKYNRK